MPKNRLVPKPSNSVGEGLVKYLNAIEGRPELNKSILVRDLERQLAEGSISFGHAANAIILFVRFEVVMDALWSCTDRARVRQCASGCGEWFFAHTKKQRHCSPVCRNKAWERSLTEEQRERRRVRMQRFMAGYYDEQFKAKPRAQAN